MATPLQEEKLSLGAQMEKLPRGTEWHSASLCHLSACLCWCSWFLLSLEAVKIGLHRVGRPSPQCL